MSTPNPSLGAGPRNIRSDPVFFFSLALFFVYGVVFNIIPVSFPIFRTRFAATLEQLGQSQSLFFISALVFSALGGWIIGALGLRRSLIASFSVLAMSLVVIGAAPDFSVVLLGIACFGLAMFATMISASSLIAEYFGEKRQSVFFFSGIGDSAASIVGPAVFGWWFARTAPPGEGWRSGYYAASLTFLVMAAWTWLLPFPARHRDKTAAAQGGGGLSTTAAILRESAIYGIGFLGFLHGLAQGGATSFVGQLHQQKFGIDAAQAAYLLSANSVGLLVGRSVLGSLTARRHTPELLVLGVCGFGAAAAFVGTILAPTYLIGLIVFGVAGAFVSANGPSLSSYLGIRFAGRTAAAFALFTGLNSVGGAGGAYLIGFAGTRFGVEAGMWCIPAASVALGITAVVWLLRLQSAKAEREEMSK